MLGLLDYNQVLIWFMLVMTSIALVGITVHTRIRRADMRFAKSLGLAMHHVPCKPSKLGMPFALLRDEARVLWTMTGSVMNTDVTIFNLFVRGGARTSPFKRPASSKPKRLSCVVMPLPIHCDSVEISREGLRSTLARLASFRDIEFESERFNRQFDIRASSPRFATALLDARMIDWLTNLGGRWCFEVHDRQMLCYGPALVGPALGEVIKTSFAFRKRIPTVAEAFSSTAPGLSNQVPGEWSAPLNVSGGGFR